MYKRRAQLAAIFTTLSKPAERPSRGLVALTEAASATPVESASAALGPGRAGLRLLAQGGIFPLYTSPSPRDRTRSRMPSSA